MKDQVTNTLIIMFTVAIFSCFSIIATYKENQKTHDLFNNHNRMHNLIIDSIQMHDQFERNYECDNYYPCPVSVECDLN